MKHTKGEWTIETPCGFPYSGLYVVPVIRKDFPCYIAQIRQLRERGESEANASLIAAAPDLLDACKLALAKFRLMYDKIEAGYDAEDLYTDSKAWPLATLRNAIAKAKQ